MAQRYNSWAFYLMLICLGLASYSVYSNLNHGWQIAPPNYVLLLISLLAFIMGMIGFKDKRNWKTKTRSWLTLILSFFLGSALLLVVMLSFAASAIGANEYLKTVQSPNDHYTIDFYRYDAGAFGSFGVRGELNGPLWFKKRIFYQDSIEKVHVEWKDSTTVYINEHLLDLKEGETYGY